MAGIIDALVILFFYIVIVFLCLWLLRGIIDTINFRKAEKMFFNDLDKQLNGGLVKKLEDVVRIQQTVSEEIGFPLFTSEDLAPLLRIYLRRITYSKERNKNKKICNCSPLRLN